MTLSDDELALIIDALDMVVAMANRKHPPETMTLIEHRAALAKSARVKFIQEWQLARARSANPPL